MVYWTSIDIVIVSLNLNEYLIYFIGVKTIYTLLLTASEFHRMQDFTDNCEHYYRGSCTIYDNSKKTEEEYLLYERCKRPVTFSGKGLRIVAGKLVYIHEILAEMKLTVTGNGKYGRIFFFLFYRCILSFRELRFGKIL